MFIGWTFFDKNGFSVFVPIDGIYDDLFSAFIDGNRIDVRRIAVAFIGGESEQVRNTHSPDARANDD